MILLKANRFSWFCITFCLCIKFGLDFNFKISSTEAQPIESTVKPTRNLDNTLSPAKLDRSLVYTAIDLTVMQTEVIYSVGPMLSPGAIGWGRHANSAQLSGAFRPPQKHQGKVVSWIDGRGGTIYFPISTTENQLEELLIWLQPVSSHQVVSIFYR